MIKEASPHARRQAVRAPYLFYIQHPVTGSYLHMSGEGFVKKTDYAWSGTGLQAKELAKVNPLIAVCNRSYVHSNRDRQARSGVAG